MNDTDDRRQRTLVGGLAILFALMALLAGLDLAADLREGTTARHAAIEGGVVIVGLTGAIWMASRHRATVRRARALVHANAELLRTSTHLAERADALAQQNDDLAQAQRALAARADQLEANLAASRQDAARWRDEARDLIAGLGAAIDRQLERWNLTPAEKEIALLLLKGLSHKEIADLRGVSEATVRQQARALYKKAGLGGRADLAAFFLEDLLGPAPRA